ncbi:MAG TPA: 1-deoxy-D-xylulose-5-phosphate synthase [Alphaproteobacteria bacterium]|nr:1-deoxy-D-xylulose-5-phosphate synthase [Alphaproteobacteria bacterium]
MEDSAPRITRDAQAASARSAAPILDKIRFPEDLRALPKAMLPNVCRELRQEVIDIVSQTGGHLGAGLGVVELTVALHYVLQTPQAKLLWDVSHQCYPHKILTGRREAMRTVRMDSGISGFTSRQESPYDAFGAAHSSTAISAALGYATARDYSRDDFPVVAVVGDGALSAGMAYEGLNNAGVSGRRMIIVINDNDMSIAPPSGAMSAHLRELRSRLPERGHRMQALAAGLLPSFAGAPTLFDDLGCTYAGPFEGHDIGEMVQLLQTAVNHEGGPLVLHVLTEKGKGYPPAERAADRYHGVSPFDVVTGEQTKISGKTPSYTNVFANTLIEAARRDDRIVAVTAAMPSGTGLDKFGKEFPDRTFDVGIAEQHAVTFCGGLACEGYVPFAAIYSTFLQRAYDQVVHDIAIQRVPVRFGIDRAGMVGADGVTHQGSYDITYLGALPGFVLMGAADEAELVRMVATAVAIDDRPSAVRYPRGEGVGVPMPAYGETLEIGRGRIAREGTRIAILSYGARLASALQAADQLEESGVSVTVADARFAKPVDADLVLRLLREHELVVTVEEGAIGGFAAQVMNAVVQCRRESLLRKFCPLYLPDRFIDQGKPAHQVAQAGLDATGIISAVRARLN